MKDRFSVDGIERPTELCSPAIDLMVRHASVRAYDQNRPLPEGLLTVLMAAAQSASTSSNMQTWSVVEVADPERRRTLRKYCSDQEFIDEAPLFLVFCADSYRLRWMSRRQGYPFKIDPVDLLLIASIDSALACQNMVMAAESLGMGCCMVGNIRNKPREVAELLELPEGVFATVGLTIGYPAMGSEVKPRLPQSAILHRDRYSAEGMEEAVTAYDRRLAESDLYVGRRARVPGMTPEPELDTDYYGWIEHTARRTAYGRGPGYNLQPLLREKGLLP